MKTKGKWDWIKSIKVGDILVEKKTPRIVRAVSHQPEDPSICKTYVWFTIRRCSWTTRCYTVLTGNDLRQRNFRLAGKRVQLNKPIDAAIAMEFGEMKPAKIKLHCCDVEGIG